VPCARLTEPASAPPEPEALRWSGQTPDLAAVAWTGQERLT